MQTPLTILIYHRVHAFPDPLFPEDMHARRFDQHLRLLAKWFNVMALPDALRRLREGTLPAGSASITFDDGYADNAEVALPLLQRHHLAATFFIASGYLDGGQMWNDAIIDLVRHAKGDTLNLSRAGLGRYDIRTPALRRNAIGSLLSTLKPLEPRERMCRVRSVTRQLAPTMMSADQLLALHRAGMDIGAHTISHPILCSVPDTEAHGEIAGSRRQLEAIIQAPVRLFAYPNGRLGTDFSMIHVAQVQALGFEGAVTTAWGAARPHTNPFLLPRFTPWDRANGRFLLRLAHNLFRRAA